MGRRCQPISDRMRRLLARSHRDERGSVAAYTAIFSMLALGAGALALDVGRMTVLRAQMQNRADAGAMAGATQLDGRPGAQARATQLATTAITQASGIPANGAALTVQTVNFFSALEPEAVPAVGDGDSRYIEVILEPKQVDLLFAPMFTFTNPGVARAATLTSLSTAQPSPFICSAPPLMICDPKEGLSDFDLASTTSIGRQIRLKPPPGGGAWAPGNFGLLALPDGSQGANMLSQALSAVTPPGCYALDVSTAPGVKFTQIKDGLNTRFDLPGGGPWPAPNVVNYPRDANLAADPEASFGNGTWDLNAYWSVKHGGSPPEALAGASRYQVYLYEIGETFARLGRQTIHPVDGEIPADFTLVEPPAPNLPTSTVYPDDPDYDGRPSQPVANNGAERRLLKVAVLQCVAQNVRGSHTYPTNGDFIEVFMTETVDDAPEGALYGEVVRTLTPSNDPDFHANVRLVR